MNNKKIGKLAVTGIITLSAAIRQLYKIILSDGAVSITMYS